MKITFEARAVYSDHKHVEVLTIDVPLAPPESDPDARHTWFCEQLISHTGDGSAWRDEGATRAPPQRCLGVAPIRPAPPTGEYEM